MDYAEFSRLCETTVRAFLGRIPAKYREDFEYLLTGGEQRMAVTNLAVTLVDDQVPVTPAECEDVRRLLEYLKEPTDKLDQLNVIPTHDRAREQAATKIHCRNEAATGLDSVG